MSRLCEGRVAIVTGGARGVGREHALLLAKTGAKVVVNDIGAGIDGSGRDDSLAAGVVEEIRAMGGEAVVNGELSNVNGRILLTGAEIGGDVTTVTGDVRIDQSVLKSDLVIEEPSSWNKASNRKPRIVVGPGSRVEGAIVVEYEVELFISEDAEVTEVRGVMTLDDAQRFSGDVP